MSKVWTVLRKYYPYIIAFLIYFPFLFMGYGSDSDTYSVLWTGEKFVQSFDYIPSRPPGFIVFETLVFFLNRLGGSFLTNLFVFFMFFVFLYCFIQILQSNNMGNGNILALVIIFHPLVWVEATSTMDFFSALGFVWLGFYLLLKDRWWGAGLAFALGIGSRATSVILVGCILLFVCVYTPQNWKRIFAAGFIAVLLSVVFYLPPLDFSKWTLRFLKPAVGGEEYWTPMLRFGRWGYKSMNFWGIPVWIVFIYSLVRLWKTGRSFLTAEWKWIAFSLVGIIAYEIFYIFIPTEPAYLLPTIPLWMILISLIFRQNTKILWIIVAFLFVSNFIAINFAKPNDKNHATSVQYGIWVEKGHLIVETEERLRYVDCGYQMCPEDLPQE